MSPGNVFIQTPSKSQMIQDSPIPLPLLRWFFLWLWAASTLRHLPIDDKDGYQGEELEVVSRGTPKARKKWKYILKTGNDVNVNGCHLYKQLFTHHRVFCLEPSLLMLALFLNHIAGYTMTVWCSMLVAFKAASSTEISTWHVSNRSEIFHVAWWNHVDPQCWWLNA